MIPIDPLSLRKNVKVVLECTLSAELGGWMFVHSAQPRREVKKENLQATFPSACCHLGQYQ